MACSCNSLDCQFNEKVVDRQRRRLSRKGPDRTTRMLVEALVEPGVEGQSVLDVGAGLGTVARDLLEAGARRAVLVEASPAYHAAARALAEEGGYADRAEFELGDFLDLAPAVGSADVVVLDRVICCYPDLRGLLGATAARAARAYGAVYPRDRWAVRAVVWLQNLLRGLTGSSFRVYVYPEDEIEAILRERGLERRSSQRTLVWEVAVYARDGAGRDAPGD